MPAHKKPGYDKHEAVRDWKRRNPDKLKVYRRRERARYWGITLDQWDAIDSYQGHVCAICGGMCDTGNRLALDHNHETGLIRGLLCRTCNQTLGHFRDDPDRLRKAAAYLERGFTYEKGEEKVYLYTDRFTSRDKAAGPRREIHEDGHISMHTPDWSVV